MPGSRRRSPPPVAAPARAGRPRSAAHAVAAGRVLHYWPRAAAVLVLLEAELRVGDEIHLRGATTDHCQAITALRREGEPVEAASAGEQVSFPVAAPARPGDRLYRLRW